MVAKAFLIAAVALLPIASACVVTKVQVPAAPAIPAASGNKAPDAYDSAGVSQHFDVNVNKATFVRSSKNTISFSCVDSRSELPLLGTPGGDMAELMGGIALYFNMTGAAVTKDAVSAILKNFLDTLPRQRTFYFHQGDGHMRQVYAEVNAATGKKYVTMPDVLPQGEEAAWMASLTKGAFQGCGHIRLMIDQPTDYGLPNSDVPKFVIEAFYKYWWTTPVGSTQRRKINFDILQGPLSGKAVAIVNATATGTAASCLKTQQPAVATSHIGSQVFVYHQAAASSYRLDVLSPFFAKYAKDTGATLDLEAFKKRYTALHGTQLGSTLKFLLPVANLDVYVANLEVSRK